MTLQELWTTAWSPRNAVFAIPVTAGLVVLALVATLQVGPVVSAHWHRYQEAKLEAKLLEWDPGPWALTVQDFPEGAATQIPVERGWLGQWNDYRDDDEPGRDDEMVPSPRRMPVLRHLGSRPFESVVNASLRDGRPMTSGVRVGAAEVFTAVLPEARWSHSPETITRIYRSKLLDEAHLRGRTLTDGSEVGGFRAVGDDPGTVGEERLTLPWDRYDDRDLDTGVHGYAGFTAVETGPRGQDPRRVTVAMTIVDDSLVLVGTSLPVGAVASPALEVPALLDQVATKISSAPAEIPGPRAVALPALRHCERPAGGSWCHQGQTLRRQS